MFSFEGLETSAGGIGVLMFVNSEAVCVNVLQAALCIGSSGTD